jgi:hypothetical protein
LHPVARIARDGNSHAGTRFISPFTSERPIRPRNISPATNFLAGFAPGLRLCNMARIHRSKPIARRMAPAMTTEELLLAALYVNPDDTGTREVLRQLLARRKSAPDLAEAPCASCKRRLLQVELFDVGDGVWGCARCLAGVLRTVANFDATYMRLANALADVGNAARRVRAW